MTMKHYTDGSHIGYSVTDRCQKCGKPFVYVGDGFAPELICMGHKELNPPSGGTNVQTTFQYVPFDNTPQLLDRIAKALERIADRLDEVHQ